MNVVKIFDAFNFNNLILVFKNNFSHSTLNRVKCEKQIITSVRFEVTTPAFAASVISLDHNAEKMLGSLWREILLMYLYISLGVVRFLLWIHCSLAERRLPRMQEVVGSNSTESKICFSHFTLFNVKCEEVFWKTNIKLLKEIVWKWKMIGERNCHCLLWLKCSSEMQTALQI